MRKFISIAVLLTLFVFLLFPFDAYCIDSDDIAFSLSSTSSIDNNRLFFVDVNAKNTNKSSKTSLSCVRLCVEYDTDAFEYRSVKSNIDKAYVTASESGGKVNIIFATKDYISIDDLSLLLSIQFKSLKEGSYDMSIYCDEATSNSLEYLECDESFSYTITVNGKTVKLKENNESSKKSKTTKTAGKSKISTADENEVQDDDFSMFFDSENGVKNAVLIGVLSGILCVLLVLSGVIIGKKVNDNKRKSEDDTDKDEKADETEEESASDNISLKIADDTLSGVSNDTPDNENSKNKEKEENTENIDNTENKKP